ncbi:MAG: DUF2461 domain-containing protein [Gemmatimonadales bacterium]
MSDFAGFPRATRRFFADLGRNNNKPWFENNRPTYEAAVRTPMKALIEAFDVALAGVAPEFIGDPRRSMFRINRDIRFSKDKSPYKTNAGCWFYHRDAGRGVGQEADSGGAGFYFHVDAKESFFAAGVWMPSRPALAKLREALVEDWETFAGIVKAPAFRRRFGDLDPSARLTRVPRGFAPDHPAADWLRFQSFTVARALSATEIAGPGLVRGMAEDAARLTPFVRWLNSAMGFEPARSRL